MSCDSSLSTLRDGAVEYLGSRCQDAQKTGESLTLVTLGSDLEANVITEYDLATCVACIEDSNVVGPETVGDAGVLHGKSLSGAIHDATATALIEWAIENTDVPLLAVTQSFESEDSRDTPQ